MNYILKFPVLFIFPRYIGLLFLSTIFSYSSLGQNLKNLNIDSLKNEIHTNNIDSIILNSYVLLVKKEFYANKDSAIHHAEQGIKFAKKTNNSKKELTLYKWLTKTYSNKGDYINLFHANEKYFYSALSYNDSAHIVDALGSKGRIFLDVGLSEYALKYNQEAIDSANKFGLKPNEANHLFLAGWYLFNMQRYEESEKSFQSSINIYKELKDTNNLYKLYGWIANAYNGLKQFDKAINYRYRFINYKLKKQHNYGIGEGYRYLADIYANKEDLDSAITNYKKAINYYVKSSAPRHQLMLVLLANTYYRNNQFNQAKRTIDKLLEKNDKPKDLYATYIGSKIGSKIYKKTGDLSKSITCFEDYININDSLNKNQEAQIVLQNSIASELQKEHQKLIFEQEKKDAKAQAQVNQQKIISYSMGLGLTSLLIFLFFVIRMLIRKRKDHDFIQAQHQELEVKNKEIIDSINYAKRIQTAILPSENQIKKHLKDSFVLYQPKDIVAGDFYWITQINNKVFFAVADCTGHGVPGAMVSVICNNGLNRAVREYGLTDPGKILDKTREIVIEEFEKSSDDVKDGMDIALCCLENNNLEYAGAHNPLWLIRDNELLTIKANKQPIGKFDSKEPYTTHKIELKKGDSLYLFSDGYVDQFGGEKGKKFKTSGFRNLLLNIQSKVMQEQQKIIKDNFFKWKGNMEQIDDVCVIGVKF